MKKETTEETLFPTVRKGSYMRVRKNERTKIISRLEVNEGIQGDTIEVMMERIREGEGEDSISERDLVYNSEESSTVNPLTNIRSDRMELMLEEKIGKQNWERAKNQKVTEEIEKVIKDENEKINDLGKADKTD